MQLRVLSSDGATARVRATGKITPDSFSSDSEPVAALLGNDVYSRPVLLSLEGADYINSSGVGWLLVCHKRCREAGGKLVIHSIPKMIRQVLEVLKMDRVFCLARDEAAAEKAAQQPDA